MKEIRYEIQLMLLKIKETKPYKLITDHNSVITKKKKNSKM